MAQNYVAVYSRLAKAFRRARAGNETAKQDKFQAQSLVPCDHAPIAAKRDLAAVAAAPRDAGLGVLQ
jgi:hypothetical protein